jgi:hypothetical protein
MKLNLLLQQSKCITADDTCNPCTAFSQSKESLGGLGRAEYIEVEPNVKLHVTDLGKGRR